MNKDKLFEMARDSGLPISWWEKARANGDDVNWRELELFAKKIVAICVDKIESHRIPSGNSAAGELAAEWTYDALLSVRREIFEEFDLHRS